MFVPEAKRPLRLGTWARLLCGGLALTAPSSDARAQPPQSAPADARARELAASPAMQRQLTSLRQQKAALGWTFDPVYTTAMDSDLRVLAALRRPADLPQRIRARNAIATPFLQRPRGVLRAAASGCNRAAARFDWRALNGATPVRQQGLCGSCWIFSAHGAAEGSWLVANQSAIDSSEQNTLDCISEGSACDGGWPSQALDFLQSRGSALESSYRYQAKKGSCDRSVSQPFRLVDWGYVGDGDGVPGVERLKEALCFYGPLSVAVNATAAFQSYGTDQVFNERASGEVNHAVTLIGWDEDKHAWLIKNSWGTSWGTTGGLGSERGYMWIEYGSNKIGYAAMWTVAQQASVTPTPQADTWRIREPIVKRAVTVYDGRDAAPRIELQPGDTVDVTAGGCVQTGGSGSTWKRYVNPLGDNASRRYFAQIDIPGVTNGLEPLRNHCQFNDAKNPDVCTARFPRPVPSGLSASARVLRLGYPDDDHSDNGYWGHDDGTQNQCKGVGNAYLTIVITHGRAP